MFSGLGGREVLFLVLTYHGTMHSREYLVRVVKSRTAV